MAKIHFIQDSYLNESLGIMCLSSYLKANGHQVELSFTSWGLDEVFAELRRSKPDIIAFSVMTAQESGYRTTAKRIKAGFKDVRVIWGGPHCTFMPEQVAAVDEVDLFAVGEGEETLLSVMNRLDRGRDFSGIPGLWHRKADRQWVQGRVGRLEDLDKYPFPDRELYYGKSRLLRDFDFKRVMTGRGCPYKCSFCFEPAWSELYEGNGKVIRRRRPATAVAEIKELVTRYPTKTIHFSDVTFNLNRKTWLKDFLPLYKKEVGLPFTANISLGMVDEEFVRGMKEAGCFGLTFGLETGNERIRMKVLEKDVTNAEVIRATDLFRKYGLKFDTFIMYGLPTETLDHAIETLEMCRRIGVNAARVGIMKIYKGSRLAEYALTRDYGEAEGRLTYKAKDPNDEHKYMGNLMWLTHYFIKVPGLIRFAKPILRFPYIGCLRFMMILTYWPEIHFFQTSLWSSLRYFLASRRTFMDGIGERQHDVYVEMPEDRCRSWLFSCLAGGGLALSALQPSSGVAGEPEPPNVVFIVLDAARADHFSSYGYGKKTTPRMDEIARQGALFLDNFSPGTLTQESLPGIFSSRRFSSQFFSTRSRARGVGRKENPRSIFLGFDPQQAFLPQVLSARGYHTVLFSDHMYLSDDSFFTRLFDERHSDFQRHQGPESRIFSSLTAWLKENKTRRFFVYLHLFSPHWSGRSTQNLPLPPGSKPHRPEDVDFLGDVTADLVKSINLKTQNLPMDASIRKAVGGYDEKEVQTIRSLYDRSLRVVDGHVGALYDSLRELGLAGKTLLVITADHGENLTEHDRFGHGGPPWDSVTRVPLILVYPPRVRPGAKVQGLTESIDLMPTILELAHAPLPPNKAMDGVSLLGVVDHPATAKTAVFWKDAVRTPDYKCLKTKNGLSLYGLRDDPGETTDIADRKPAVAKELMERHELAVHDMRARHEASRRVGPPDFSFTYPVSEFQMAPSDAVSVTDLSSAPSDAPQSGASPWLMNTDRSEYGLYRTPSGDPSALTLSAPVPDGRYRISLLFRYNRRIAPEEFGFRFRLRPNDEFIAAGTLAERVTSSGLHYFAASLGEVSVTDDRFSVEIRLPPARENAHGMLRSVLFDPAGAMPATPREKLEEAGYW